jgi:hypothetical protein
MSNLIFRDVDTVAEGRYQVTEVYEPDVESDSEVSRYEFLTNLTAEETAQEAVYMQGEVGDYDYFAYKSVTSRDNVFVIEGVGVDVWHIITHRLGEGNVEEVHTFDSNGELVRKLFETDEELEVINNLSPAGNLLYQAMKKI